MGERGDERDQAELRREGLGRDATRSLSPASSRARQNGSAMLPTPRAITRAAALAVNGARSFASSALRPAASATPSTPAKASDASSRIPADVALAAWDTRTLPSKERRYELIKARCDIFGTEYNPDRVRNGANILKQRLTGEIKAAYYGPRLVNISKLNRLYTPEGEEPMFRDLIDEQRCVSTIQGSVPRHPGADRVAFAGGKTSRRRTGAASSSRRRVRFASGGSSPGFADSQSARCYRPGSSCDDEEEVDAVRLRNPSFPRSRFPRHDRLLCILSFCTLRSLLICASRHRHATCRIKSSRFSRVCAALAEHTSPLCTALLFASYIGVRTLDCWPEYRLTRAASATSSLRREGRCL